MEAPKLKTCTKCGTPKILDDFVKDNRRSDGRAAQCLACMRDYQNALSQTPHRRASRAVWAATNEEAERVRRQQRYQNNAAHIKSNVAARKKLATAIINSMRAACKDCERSFSACCLDFDHVRGAKILNVSLMRGHRSDVLLSEIAKCDVVCAVCHRIRTDKQRPRSVTPSQVRFHERLAPLKTQPCTDCGLTFPPVAMDFDHVRGEKKYSVSQMANRKWEQVLMELAKCELVCACCHRIRTQTRKTAEAA